MAFADTEKLQVIKRKISEFFVSSEFDGISTFAELKTFITKISAANVVANVITEIDSEIVLRIARSTQETTYNTNLTELKTELGTLFQ